MAQIFSRILVPTDLSEPSDAALAYAKRLAQSFQASLHVLHVVEDSMMPTTKADGLEEVPVGLTAWLEEGAARALAERFDAAEQSRYGGGVEIRTGTLAAKAIVDVANELHADLIVMGTHGRRGLAHLLLGSVAEQVVRTAACPVLTVRRACVTAGADARTDATLVPAV